MNANLRPALLALALLPQACAPATPSDGRGKVATQANSPRRTAPAADSFDEYMRAEFAPADGFDFPFGGGAYFGGHWIRINYPNRFDAARGRAAKLITPEQEATIDAAWERRGQTLETTRLGGDIGFHGWAREWEDDGPRHLSWGCVVLHLKDISDFYERLPKGAMVVIF